MHQWEYKIIDLVEHQQFEEDVQAFDAQVERLGRQGWEAVSMNNTQILFKRKTFYD